MLYTDKVKTLQYYRQEHNSSHNELVWSSRLFDKSIKLFKILTLTKINKLFLNYLIKINGL